MSKVVNAVTLVVEGVTDEVVAKRLLDENGWICSFVYGKAGKAAIDRALTGYNNAARFSQWLVLRDLDSDAACAPELREALLASPSRGMRLHVAVHAVEAWLLGDSEALSDFLAVPRDRVPADPERLVHPKRTLLELARRSRRRAIREALVPAAGMTAQVGPGYAAALITFATSHWRPVVAASKCESLERLRRFLRRLSSERAGSC
ncbi:MAG: hypothetical protein AB1689_06335 [Thermodesulfobacteriota bacterium]